MVDKRNKTILLGKNEQHYERTFLTTLKKGYTPRGFGFYEFKDRYDQKCSLQDSSLATEPAIWFGVDVNIKGESVGNSRMHLTQEQVKALLPTLTYFAETGNYVRDFKRTDINDNPEIQTTEYKKNEEYSFRLIGDIYQVATQEDFLLLHKILVEFGPMEFGHTYPYIRNCDKEKVFDLIWKNKCVGWWHYSDYYEEYEICTKEEFQKALDDEKIKR